MRYYNNKPILKEGLILSRPNRFLMNVMIDNKEYICHCPSTGRIGNIEFSKIPCLVSESSNIKRKTKHTVEAISLDPLNTRNKSWIGINQSKINTYVNYFLNKNILHLMVKDINQISREYIYHNSRFDFKINDNIFLEVKMPLQTLQVDYGSHLSLKKQTSFSSVDRLIKHLNDLSLLSLEGNRIIMLVCFLYQNPGFNVQNQSKKYIDIQSSVSNAIRSGLEIWQLNLKMTSTSIIFDNLFEITPKFIQKL